MLEHPCTDIVHSHVARVRVERECTSGRRLWMLTERNEVSVRDADVCGAIGVIGSMSAVAPNRRTTLDAYKSQLGMDYGM